PRRTLSPTETAHREHTHRLNHRNVVRDHAAPSQPLNGASRTHPPHQPPKRRVRPRRTHQQSMAQRDPRRTHHSQTPAPDRAPVVRLPDCDPLPQAPFIEDAGGPVPAPPRAMPPAAATAEHSIVNAPMLPLAPEAHMLLALIGRALDPDADAATRDAAR